MRSVANTEPSSCRGSDDLRKPAVLISRSVHRIAVHVNAPKLEKNVGKVDGAVAGSVLSDGKGHRGGGNVRPVGHAQRHGVDGDFRRGSLETPIVDPPRVPAD